MAGVGAAGAAAILEQLAQVVAETPPADLPAIAGRLREAELIVELRLRSAAPPLSPGTAPAVERWLTPEQAAGVAILPVATPQDLERSVRRVYGWAKGKRWASNPTGRHLLIEEAGFRRWLASRPR